MENNETKQELGGIQLKCPKCGYGWTYRGKYVDRKKKYYTSCPRCRSLVKITQKE